jgi:autotransporter-associated beta strand protein
MNPVVHSFAAWRIYASISILFFSLVLNVCAQAQTGFTDVTVSTGATSNGTWSPAFAPGAGPYTFTPTGANSTANVNITEIVDRLGGTNANLTSTNNVTIITTNASGTGNGDITISNAMTITNYVNAAPFAHTLTLNAGRNILVSNPINLTPAVPGNGAVGRPAPPLTVIAGNNFTVSSAGSITCSGGSGGMGSGASGGNGSAITITAGSAGAVHIAGAITTNGGPATKGSGGHAGAISITAPGGISLSAGLSANGGTATSTSYSNGNGGNISINDGATTVTSGGANDGQTAGIIAAIAGTGGTVGTGTGGNFTKSGAGTLMLSQLSTYTGTTSVNAGIVRVSTNNVTASANGPLGNNASGLNLNGGAIQTNVTTFSRPITVTATNSGLDAYGAARTISASITFTGSYNLNVGATTVASAEGQPLTLSGTISNSAGLFSLTKTGNSTLSFGSQTITLNTLTIDAGTTFTATSGNLHITGNFSNSGTFVHNSGAVTLDGTSTQTIGGTAAIPLFNLVTNNTAGFTLNNDLSVSGTHTFTNGIITTSATPHYLIYEAGSSYTGNSNTRHVNGWVRKAGTTAFTFPVGNGTVERTIAISNLSAASVFNARYAGATTNTGNVTPPLVAVDPNEYWNVNQVSGGSAQVALNWDNSKIAFPSYTLSDIRVANYTAGNWASIGGSATGTVSSTGTITSSSVGSFGAFTFGTISGSLPVHWVQFSARLSNGHALLSWTVADETAVDHYEVQRSDDGNTFYSTGRVTARNVPALQSYHYTDSLAIKDVAYYRIRSVDKDGKANLSKIATISDRLLAANYFKVTSPARGSIAFTAGPRHHGVYTYKLITTGGQTIQQGRVLLTNGGYYTIPLATPVVRGVYILQVQHGSFRHIQRIFVE